MRYLIAIVVLAGTCVWSNNAYNYQRSNPSTAMLTQQQGKLPNSTKDEKWKLAEREQLFWLLQDGKVDSQKELEKWQKQQKNLLLAISVNNGISLEEIKNWQQKEMDSYKTVVNKYGRGNSNQSDWQKHEQDRINWLIHQNQMTQEDLKRWQTKNNQDLVILAEHYQISIEELNEYYLKEFNRHHLPSSDNEQNSPKYDIDSLNELNSMAIQLREKIQSERDRYKSLAQQYKQVKDQETFLKTELESLTKTINNQQEEMKIIQKDQSVIPHQKSTLSDSQMTKVLDKVKEIVKFKNMAVEQFKAQSEDSGSEEQMVLSIIDSYDEVLKILKQQTEILFDQKKFFKNKLDNLNEMIDEQQAEIKSISNWQPSEGNKPKINNYTMEELLQENMSVESDMENIEFWIKSQLQSLKNDEEFEEDNAAGNSSCFEILANEYHISVQDIEEWIKQQQHMIQNASEEDGDISFNSWQQIERDYLVALVNSNHITKRTNFQNYLTDYGMRIRMAKVAARYGTTVDEINDFWRVEYKRLKQLDLISEGADAFEIAPWQSREQLYIQYLLQDHKWSVEELERELMKRIQKISRHNHVVANEIVGWYHTVLEKLLQDKTLHSENLADWQKLEKHRLYTIIVDQNTSIEDLEKQLQRGKVFRRHLAAKYHIALDELINWQEKELQRLANLNYGVPTDSGRLKDWQVMERNRLRSIPEMVIITREELLEFINSDQLFQNNLIAKYQVSSKELSSYQNKELRWMEYEGVLESLDVKPLSEWQIKERDRLYGLIRDENFSSKNLSQWQDGFKMTGIASLYNIPAETLMNWQTEVMQRIEKISKHYEMSLTILETFRESELERLEMIAHKDFLANASIFINWSEGEVTRLNNLTIQTDASGARLDKWRRKLFLLAQDLIDLNSNEDDYSYGEMELNNMQSQLIYDGGSYGKPSFNSFAKNNASPEGSNDDGQEVKMTAEEIRDQQAKLSEEVQLLSKSIKNLSLERFATAE